jgi:SAM-dependent methyltransferase
MTISQPATPQAAAPQYQQVPRSRIRYAHRRNLYAYHIQRLQDALRMLIPELALRDGGALLDYGCADMPYRAFFPAGVKYVGADLPGNDAATLILNPDGTVPASDESFDVVLSTQVLEHVRDPRVYLAECRRVVRPGGRLLLSTHGVFPYHPDPSDLWRWTCEGLRREVELAGFEIVRFEGVIGLAATGLQLLQDAISYRIPWTWKPRLALVMQPIVAFADRFETRASLGYNAQVFALVASRAH